MRLTPEDFSFSLSFFSGWWAGEVAASAPPATTTFGGGLTSVVARGDRAGVGAGAVARRATTAAGTEAELEVLPTGGIGLKADAVAGLLLVWAAGLSALGGSLGGG